MRKGSFLIILSFVWCLSTGVVADEKPKTAPDPEDKKVIAVMEILELMEMLQNIDMFKDMEYLTKGDPDEPRK
jgi:hypothetical protein